MNKEFLTGSVYLPVILILVLIIQARPFSAQDTYTFGQMEDSLIRLNELAENDLKVGSLIGLSDLYLDSNLNKSDSFAQLANDWAECKENPFDILLSLYQLGKVNFEKDSLDRARDYFNKVINNTDNEKILNNTLLNTRSFSFYFLAQICEKDHDSILKAIQWTKHSLRLAEQRKDSAFAGILHRFLGMQYFKLELREEGLNELNRSLRIFENTKDNKNLAINYRLLSMYANNSQTLEYIHKTIEVYARLGDSMKLALNLINMAYESKSILGIEKTEAYYKKAYQIFKRHNYPYGQAYALFILSGFYENTNRLDESYKITLQAIEYSRRNGQTNYLAHSLKNMATFHNMHGNRDSAYYYFSLLDTVSQKLESKIPRIRYFLGLSNTLIQDNRLDAAEEMLREAMKLHHLRKNFSYKSRFLWYMSMIYKRRGDYKEELRYYKQYIAEREAVYNEARRKRYARDQLKYELKNIENKIKILQKEEELKNAKIKKNQQYAQVFGLGIFLVSFLAIYFIHQYRKSREAYHKLMEKNLVLIDKNKGGRRKNNHSDLDQETRQKIQKKVEKYVIEEKTFLNPEIGLDILAKKLKTNSAYLSKAINQMHGSNFTNFINELRIREAQNLMRLPEYQHYSIEGFAKEVGFKSKSVFNTSFKKYTGLTPSYYIKFLQENPDNRQ
ncbi:MAG: helix-turn-helix domain-containing protein [Bacteroidales bacterium]|nr:helix-turn-helix domain-containing protein [Bacteroidales bacterium]MCF8386742.1 helix-turn-helix domain-containing protein [Bacteroidales bacterium]MCF8397264.1 helix-turn-helix domain-containing protein [Bacteroidales bacterium]